MFYFILYTKLERERTGRRREWKQQKSEQDGQVEHWGTRNPVPVLFQRVLMQSEAQIGRLLLLQQDHAGGGKSAGRKTENKNLRVFGQGGVEILQMSVRWKPVTGSKAVKPKLICKVDFCHPLPKSCWNSQCRTSPTSTGPVPPIPTYLFFLVFFSAALSPALIKGGKIMALINAIGKLNK